MSRDLVAKGIASANLIPDSPSWDARPLFEAAVTYASQNQIQTATAAPYGAAGTITPVPVFQCSSSGCVSLPMDLGQPTDQLIVTLYGTGIRGNTGLTNAAADVGLDQVNLVLPRSLAGAGEVPVVLTIDGQTANVVSINVK